MTLSELSPDPLDSPCRLHVLKEEELSHRSKSFSPRPFTHRLVSTRNGRDEAGCQGFFFPGRRVRDNRGVTTRPVLPTACEEQNLAETQEYE